MSGLTKAGAWKNFGGFVQQFTHHSRATQTPMRFSIFLPPQITEGGGDYSGVSSDA